MDGVFPFLKPPGITSHDAVAICRRLLKIKRIGHSGTLDPLAAGVLPIYVGRATRLIEFAEDQRKTYVGTLRFGAFTDTEDSTGTVVPSVCGIPSVTDESQLQAPSVHEVAQALSRFIGVIEQAPSQYSAIKVNGRPAYEWARAGVPVALPERTVQIYEARLIAYGFPYAVIRVSCSSGTYIRALIRDLAIALGSGAHMVSLLRERVGSFSLEQAVTGEEVAELGETVCLSPDHAVAAYPRIQLDDENIRRLVNGLSIDCNRVRSLDSDRPGGLYRIYGPHGFLGMAEAKGPLIIPRKNVIIPQ